MGKRDDTPCPICRVYVSSFKQVLCLGCMRKRRVCRNCATHFTGCNAECVEAHRVTMKTAFGNEGLIRILRKDKFEEGMK